MRKVDEDHFDPAIQQPVEGLEVSAGTPRTERVVLNEHVRGVGSAAGEPAPAAPFDLGHLEGVPRAGTALDQDGRLRPEAEVGSRPESTPIRRSQPVAIAR